LWQGLKNGTSVPTIQVVPRQALELPLSPLATPLSAQAFSEHLPIAVEAGAPLCLVLVRADASRRGRRRLEAALRAAGGFSYALEGGYALLLPGASAMEALKTAGELRWTARAHVAAAVAELGHDDTAETLFARAHDALEPGGVRVAAPRVLPLQVT
jgi:hypothetical protein